MHACAHSPPFPQPPPPLLTHVSNRSFHSQERALMGQAKEFLESLVLSHVRLGDPFFTAAQGVKFDDPTAFPATFGKRELIGTALLKYVE
jgi:hypothetical protein